MDYIIGMDIGTSSVKGLALGTDGRSLGTSSQSYPVMEDRTGRHEQDPDQVCAATFSTLKRLIESVPTGNQLKGISFSAPMHGLLCVGKDGRPLCPLITWADTRAEAIVESFRQEGSAAELYRHTGTPFHPMSPFAKLLWLKSDQEELFEKTFKFVSIKEYVWFRLFGAWEIDHSVASATGLFDITRKCWFAPALLAAGISQERLSLPVSVTYSRDDVSVQTRKAYDLPQGILYTIGGADGCLANLGSGVVSRGEASLTIGTSAALRVATKEWLPDPQGRLFQYILDDHTYIRGGALNNGGNLMDWFLSLLETNVGSNQAGNWELGALLDEAFAVQPGAEGLLFLPYLYGERAPIWDAGARGAFIGLRAHHGRAHLLRAVTEGIVFALDEIFRILDSEQPGATIGTVYASGGFTATGAWVQQVANILDRPVCLKGGADASATGAALVAMIAQNIFPSVEEASKLISRGKVFHPEKVIRLRYERCFELYQSIYPSLKHTLHALGQLS